MRQTGASDAFCCVIPWPASSELLAKVSEGLPRRVLSALTQRSSGESFADLRAPIYSYRLISEFDFFAAVFSHEVECRSTQSSYAAFASESLASRLLSQLSFGKMNSMRTEWGLL